MGCFSVHSSQGVGLAYLLNYSDNLAFAVSQKDEYSFFKQVTNLIMSQFLVLSQQGMDNRWGEWGMINQALLSPSLWGTWRPWMETSTVATIDPSSYCSVSSWCWSRCFKEERMVTKLQIMKESKGLWFQVWLKKKTAGWAKLWEINRDRTGRKSCLWRKHGCW